MGIGQEILDVPFGEMVFQLASAIATSQVQLDKASVDIMKIMGDVKQAPVSLPLLDEDGRDLEIVTSMIGAGFQPTFYQFTDAIIEVKMAISMSNESVDTQEEQWEYGPETITTTTRKGGILGLLFGSYQTQTKTTNIKSHTLNATYTSKYNFSEEASSTLRVRLVPLPPNPIMQRFVELRAERHQLEYALQMKKTELALSKLEKDNAESS